MDDDADLEAAIQQSLDQHDTEVLQRIIESSKNNTPSRDGPSGAALPLPVSQELASHHDSDDDLYVTGPSRLDTALSFANTASTKRSVPSPPKPRNKPPLFGYPTLLPSDTLNEVETSPAFDILAEDGDETEGMEVVIPVSNGYSFAASATKSSETPRVSLLTSDITSETEIGEEIAPSLPQPENPSQNMMDTFSHDTDRPDPSPASMHVNSAFMTSDGSHVPPSGLLSQSASLTHTDARTRAQEYPAPSPVSPIRHSDPRPANLAVEDVSDGDVVSDWGRSLSPGPRASVERDTSDRPAASNDVTHWDAAQEMDVVAEEGDFAQFLSQMKGQDLEAARQEIDSEIRELNKQKKVAMRDSEDVTQHMISQIMVGCVVHSRLRLTQDMFDS